MKPTLRLVAPESTPKEADVADFSDSTSVRVLDAAADALIAPLARQAAREDFNAWLASQRGRV